MPAMDGWLEVEEKRSPFLVCMRAATRCLSGALALLFFVTGPPAYAQQVTRCHHLSALTPKHGNVSG